MNVLSSVLFFCILLLSICGAAEAQKKAKKCRGVEMSGNFQLLFTTEEDRDPFYVYLIVSPPKQNDDNFVATSVYFKNLYCKQNDIFVAIYDSKEHSQLGGSDTGPRVTPESLPRALYHLERSTGKEGINVVKIVDGHIVNRKIEIPK